MCVCMMRLRRDGGWNIMRWNTDERNYCLLLRCVDFLSYQISFFSLLLWLLLLKLKCFQINSFICSYTRTAAEKKTSVEYNRKTSRYYVSKLSLQWYCCCAMDCYFGVRECECVLMILSSVNFDFFLCAN